MGVPRVPSSIWIKIFHLETIQLLRKIPHFWQPPCHDMDRIGSLAPSVHWGSNTFRTQRSVFGFPTAVLRILTSGSTIRFPSPHPPLLHHRGLQTNKTWLKTWCSPKSAQNLPNHSLIYIYYQYYYYYYYYLFTSFITHKSSNLSEWIAENPPFMVVFPSQNLHFLGFLSTFDSQRALSRGC